MPPPSPQASAPLSFGLLSGAPSHSFLLGSTSPATTWQSDPRPDVADIPIICVCHLSWDWVWQRPQQFLSRLAHAHPVLFVETYCSDTPQAYGRIRAAAGHPNVTIFETHLPAARWHDGDFIDAERRRVLNAALAGELQGRFDRPILWFYDPMAVTAFSGHLGERVTVYDCMDELSQFKGAPPQLLERERELLRAADVVFCGGRKMREKRLPLNPNCHFYGTGVDVTHFGAALSDALPVYPQIAALPGRVLGYFGVIDERIDYALLAKLADARPDWDIAMVGPVAKVDPSEFPRRANLHWLGGRGYEELPAITKGFAVCLMPFALNAATEYINPTKALEYMAAGRPIVSTALNEVKSNFRRVARIADSHEDFIEHCIRESTTPSRLRIDRGLRLARENTWDAIAARMDGHVRDALAAREQAAAARTRAAARPATSAEFPLTRKRAAYV